MAIKSKPTKARRASKPEKPRGEALMSSAELFRATGHGQSAIAEMKATGVISPIGKNQWPIIATLGAMYRRLRERNVGEEDRQRKNKAEADSAEIEAMKAAGDCIPAASALLYWSEARIRIRQTIERAPYLSAAQRVKLLTEITKLKDKLPEI